MVVVEAAVGKKEKTREAASGAVNRDRLPPRKKYLG